MTQDSERFRVAVGQHLKRQFAIARGQFAVQIDDRVIDLGGDGGLGQPLADRRGHVARPGAFGYLADGTIGEFQSQHEIPP